MFDERYQYVTSEEDYELITNRSKSWPKEWGTVSTMNLYQRSYIPWGTECTNQNLTPEDIYDSIGDVYKVNFWQSTFNFVCLINILVAFLIFGIISWVITAYKMFFNKGSNTLFDWFGILAAKWTTGMSILKILLVYICVSYIDKYEDSIIEISKHN